jgi:hypothetical protein
MRQLELQQLLEDASICELAQGNRVRLVFETVPVAEIVPLDAVTLNRQRVQEEREREDARQRLLELMNKGIDMGGYKITNRDELYDRE